MEVIKIKVLRKFLRKVYTKKNSNSLIFNIPLEIAKNKNIQKGNYLTVLEVKNGIFIKKTELKEDKTIEI